MAEPAKEEYASSAPAPATDLVQHDSSRDSTAIAFGATTNALSILAAAQSSAEAAIGSHIDTGHILSSHLDPATESPKSLTTGHEPMTIALADGGSATVVFAGDSVVVAQNGLSASAASGNGVTIGTHIFSAASDGKAIIVDSSATHAVPRPGHRLPATRLTVDGRVITASYLGSDVVIVDGSRTLTVYAGDPVTLGPQVISVNAGAAELVVGTSTIAFSNTVSDNPASATATAAWKADESTFMTIMQGDAIVIHGSDITITLQPGAAGTVGKEAFSIPASGGMLLHDGTTVGFEEPNTADQGGVTRLLQDGQALTVSVVGAQSSFTKAPAALLWLLEHKVR